MMRETLLFAAVAALLTALIAYAAKGVLPATQSQTPTVAMLPFDAHSYARPNEVRVKHLSWNATVDFAAHTISATAVYDLVHVTDAREVVLDAKDLNITSVKCDGRDVPFTLGERDAIKGSALTIPIEPNTKQVSITYSTAADAEALLWVDGEKPFLFTQSQAILARTWVPCQDSPGVRFTYDAHVAVRNDLMALMSADNPQQKSANGEYDFKMDKPIPAYLLALAVGDVEFRPLDERTGVYAVPSVIEKATTEFSDMPKMVTAAEALYGPYVWGRYDVLVLPGAFPFGGMENPKLTFATPTIIAGDKSLVSLIAHELAHSWSGNLVTNATWDDFWLNEGFTVYFEERIMEAVYGREFSEMLAQLNRQDLDGTLAEIGASAHPEDACLKLKLAGRSPDDGMTDIAYNKGYFMLRKIEEFKGRAAFDAFLKQYFTENAFKVMDTEQFIAYLKNHLLSEAEYTQLQLNDWIYTTATPGMPEVQSTKLSDVDTVRKQWESGLVASKALPWEKWSYQERYRFLSNLSDFIDAEQLSTLDNAWKISQTGNNEVLFAWLQQAILKKYSASYDELDTFLHTVGRRKFVAPLFEAMVKSGQKPLAEKIYSTARAGYHAVTLGTVDEVLR